jgi:hypothetical protein
VTRVSRLFKVRKSQAELDFVDVDLGTDAPLFIDPFAIALREDEFSKSCHQTLIEFFSRIVDAIRSGQDHVARKLLSHLKEPNETRFGYSRGRPQGAGIGRDQSDDLFEALRDSSAVKTGFIQSLEECELLIPGISWDKISDLTTNVIRQGVSTHSFVQDGGTSMKL